MNLLIRSRRLSQHPGVDRQLAQALPGGERGGGVLTPASGLGMVLGQRLIAAGMTLEPVRS